METRQFYTRKDKVLLYCGYALLALFSLAILLPLVYVVLASFIDPVVLTNQGISLSPDDWTLQGYTRVFQDQMIGRGFVNSFCTRLHLQYFPRLYVCWRPIRLVFRILWDAR